MSKITLAIPVTSYLEAEQIVTEWVHANLGTPLMYDSSRQAEINQWGLPWFRSGAVVCNTAGKILMVHEARVKVKKIKDESLRQKFLDEGHKPGDWVDGDGGWNIPAGRLCLGEGFEDACIREVREESGHQIIIKDYLYSKHSEEPGNQHVMPVYFAEDISGPEQYRTAETSEIGWFSLEEIRKMQANNLLRSAKSVMSSIEAYENYLAKTN
jgi:ADP-ribose pyrophosphatase YjhB (NUDIX family)